MSTTETTTTAPLVDPRSIMDEHALSMLCFNRFLLSFNNEGKIILTEIPQDAFIATPETLPNMITHGLYWGKGNHLLVELVEAAVGKLRQRGGIPPGWLEGSGEWALVRQREVKP